MKTIAITNQKGGVGKTTTALATAYGLADKGKKVLLIDLDPQQNASLVLGIRGATPTSLDVMLKKSGITEAIRAAGSVHAIPADRYAGEADEAMKASYPKGGAMQALKNALGSVGAFYDYCIIDTPPDMHTLSINALTAADYAVIPVEADVFSITSLEEVRVSIQTVKASINPELTIAGVLLTKAKKRTVLNRDIKEQLEQIAQAMGAVLFDTAIRDSIRPAEAAIMHRSLYDYAPRDGVTNDYRAYIAQLEQRTNN